MKDTKELTKRELMAAHVASGALVGMEDVEHPKVFARFVIKVVDALIAELDRTNETTN